MIAAAVFTAGVGGAAPGSGRMLVGHKEPLREERLPKAIPLGCGLRIVEWRPGPPGPDRIAWMEDLCARGLRAFQRVAAEGGAKLRRSGPLAWRLALIPVGRCYRCIDDLEHRFASTSREPNVWGITFPRSGWTFIASDMPPELFEEVFLHELFHALSAFHGLLPRSAQPSEEQLIANELGAMAFPGRVKREP